MHNYKVKMRRCSRLLLNEVMKRKLRIFSVGVLTLLLVVIAGAVIVHRRNNVDRKDISYAASSPLKPCWEYKDLGAALSYTKEGEPVSSHTYMASDGTTVNSTYAYYKSPKKANKELSTKLISAMRIIKREPNLNENGKETGVRVIALFRKSDVSGDNEYELLWTETSNFNVIRSPSLPHLLQFDDPACFKR